MKIQIELPCKPLVKQYITNRYGNPVRWPHNDFLRSLLVRFLERPDTSHDSEVNIQYYTATVDLPITMGEYERYGNALTPTAIRHINQTVQDIIEEVLFNYLHFYHYCGKMKIKDAIVAFRHAYHFDEEHYSTDAIQKFFYREREKREKVKMVA